MLIPDAALDLAEAQRGVIARYQLRRHMPRQVVDDLFRGPRCVRIGRGVVRLRGAPDLVEHAAFAAALRARPRATVTGPVALRLLGVPGFGDARGFEVLTVPTRHLSTTAFAHGTDPDPGRAVTTHGEVRVSGPLDALIHSAALRDGRTDRDLRVAWITCVARVS